ncbi:ROK family glucokinase [Nocardioides anomalus]|uniref:Glucokinase n=1 Tax=Nocardioides anomalus TaxID=2712223 RepID=A0A6G6WBR7_9ACTN|nr:ROK family glucokinase [Nocardioides anomalus]
MTVAAPARRTRVPRWDPLTVGVDIGGTKILAGVVDSHGSVVEVQRRPTTGHDVALVEDTIVDLVQGFQQQYDVAAVGVGAAGFVDASRSTVMFSPHLAWRDEPLRDRLTARMSIPVVVDNDANTTALGESRFGAGVGHRFVLCITLGTGIGGAIVLDGRVYRGANGMAGEFGHMQVVPDGHRCPCGNRGCWEQYASGNALEREARELVVARSPMAHALRELCGDDPDQLSGPQVTAAAQAGDPISVELIADVGRWLGTGVAGLVAAFDPSAVIIGGGVSDAGELLLAPTRDSMVRHLVGRGYRAEPPVVPAVLGPQAGFIGAADMARSAARRSRRADRRRDRRGRWFGVRDEL